MIPATTATARRDEVVAAIHAGSLVATWGWRDGAKAASLGRAADSAWWCSRRSLLASEWDLFSWAFAAAFVDMTRTLSAPQAVAS